MVSLHKQQCDIHLDPCLSTAHLTGFSLGHFWAFHLIYPGLFSERGLLLLSDIGLINHIKQHGGTSGVKDQLDREASRRRLLWSNVASEHSDISSCNQVAFPIFLERSVSSRSYSGCFFSQLKIKSGKAH